MEERKRNILEIQNLCTSFFLSNGKELKAVNDVSFDVHRGEMLGIAGESGSGKSVLIKSIFGLVPNPGKVVGGKILYEGNNILEYTEKQMRPLRGQDFSLIFQEPMSALNPSFSIGWQIEEVYKLHGYRFKRKERRELAIEMLKKAKIPDPEKRMREYPFQFSGGMRQRVPIAIALACAPKILFADEPTTALDVTVQADIMDLLESLQESSDMSMVLISHNLNLLAERCKRIVVMYCGRVMEIAPTAEILAHAVHPYSIGLLNSTVDIEHPDRHYQAIPGDVADATLDTSGCVFANRCANATKKCFAEMPQMKEISPGHFCCCHLVS